MTDISFGVAFTAGLASFLSPCILPLVPVYLSVLGGGKPKENRMRLIRRSMGFVLGFTAIFIVLGATASFLGSLVHSNLALLRRLAGIFMIVMGIHLSGMLPLSLLNRETRLDLGETGSRFGGPFLMGIAFALGWTPCIGPVLASILVYAGTSQTVLQGVILLLWYSFGLAIPLLITAGLAGVLSNKLRRFNRAGQIISKLSGFVMIAAGILLFFNRLSWLVSLLSR